MASLLLLLPLLGTLHLAGCTVDEGTVDNKECVPGSTDPLEQCVAGYKCVPYPDGAKCEVDKKASPLRVSDHGRQAPRLRAPLPPGLTPLAPDYAHNLQLLRRLGLSP